MKLHQTEYCHNCDKMVRFEFEDVAGTQQVIYCPECGHEHYRVLDEGWLTDIRVRPGQTEVRVAKVAPLSLQTFTCNELPLPVMAEIETVRVLAQTEDGTVVERTTALKGTATKIVTQQRWGRDPRQGG